MVSCLSCEIVHHRVGLSRLDHGFGINVASKQQLGALYGWIQKRGNKSTSLSLPFRAVWRFEEKVNHFSRRPRPASAPNGRLRPTTRYLRWPFQGRKRNRLDRKSGWYGSASAQPRYPCNNWQRP